MPDPERTWPNLERAVVAWLTGRGLTVYTETDADDTLPAERVLVERAGGSGRGLVKDVDVEVSVVSATRAGMWALAAQVETAMAALAANGDPYVDDVAEQFAFAVDPSPNTATRRATATFTLTVRPQA